MHFVFKPRPGQIAVFLFGTSMPRIARSATARTGPAVSVLEIRTVR